LWQHFAHVAGAGRVTKVNANFEFVREKGAEYDSICFLTLTTEGGLMGRLVQDVVTLPKRKSAGVQFEKGRVEWYCDVTKTLDRVITFTDKKESAVDIAKTRPDEFFQEIKHINDLLTGKFDYKKSPVRLDRGLDTMYVLNAAHQSFIQKKEVEVVYDHTQLKPIHY
jgi:predicted dehydrogenase